MYSTFVFAFAALAVLYVVLHHRKAGQQLKSSAVLEHEYAINASDDPLASIGKMTLANSLPEMETLPHAYASDGQPRSHPALELRESHIMAATSAKSGTLLYHNTRAEQSFETFSQPRNQQIYYRLPDFVCAVFGTLSVLFDRIPVQPSFGRITPILGNRLVLTASYYPPSWIPPSWYLSRALWFNFCANPVASNTISLMTCRIRDPRSRFFSAAIDGDLPALKTFFQNGDAGLNDQSADSGDTALHVCNLEVPCLSLHVSTLILFRSTQLDISG
jgi:hypothetical protein